MTVPKVTFAATDEEAERRFENFGRLDPFPSISPALLNSADLVDYIAATGMVFPFDKENANSDKSVKPASCAIPFLGEVVYWEEDGKHEGQRAMKVREDFKSGDKFVLRKNSIAYVSLAPTFRIPDYIAARFNLAIREIHRGLLVGTGPLVDPGFKGRLSVPLHNLTSNDYELEAGECLVWMEFTKLSQNRRWLSDADAFERGGTYVEFPERKLDRKDIDRYLRRAHAGPILSSIPGSVIRAEKSAEAARKVARNWAVGGGLAVVIGIVAVVIATWTLISDESNRRSKVEADVAIVERESADLRSQIERQERRLIRQSKALIRSR